LNRRNQYGGIKKRRGNYKNGIENKTRGKKYGEREKEKEVRLGYVRKETIKKTTPSYERKSKARTKPTKKNHLKSKKPVCTACITLHCICICICISYLPRAA
jgi:hypothetical protein